jgi:hypothetical protein
MMLQLTTNNILIEINPLINPLAIPVISKGVPRRVVGSPNINKNPKAPSPPSHISSRLTIQQCVAPNNSNQTSNYDRDNVLNFTFWFCLFTFQLPRHTSDERPVTSDERPVTVPAPCPLYAAKSTKKLPKTVQFFAVFCGLLFCLFYLIATNGLGDPLRF